MMQILQIKQTSWEHLFLLEREKEEKRDKRRDKTTESTEELVFNYRKQIKHEVGAVRQWQISFRSF